MRVTMFVFCKGACEESLVTCFALSAIRTSILVPSEVDFVMCFFCIFQTAAVNVVFFSFTISEIFFQNIAWECLSHTIATFKKNFPRTRSVLLDCK